MINKRVMSAPVPIIRRISHRGRMRTRLKGLVSISVLAALFLGGFASSGLTQEGLATDYYLTHFPRADENLCTDSSACKENHVCTEASFYWFGKHCFSDMDCRVLSDPTVDENLGCTRCGVPRRYLNRCRYDGRQKRCLRRWKMTDPAYLTKLPCRKSHDCPSRLTCMSFDSDESRLSGLFQRSSTKNKFVCAYLPVRVWPYGAKPVGNHQVLQPKWFKSGGSLPGGFPQRWDLRRGPLPSAPQGYVWVYAAAGPGGNMCFRGASPLNSRPRATTITPMLLCKPPGRVWTRRARS